MAQCICFRSTLFQKYTHLSHIYIHTWSHMYGRVEYYHAVRAWMFLTYHHACMLTRGLSTIQVHFKAQISMPTQRALSNSWLQTEHHQGLSQFNRLIAINRLEQCSWADKTSRFCRKWQGTGLYQHTCTMSVVHVRIIYYSKKSKLQK